MTTSRLLRFDDRTDLVAQTATRLVEAMTTIQAKNQSVSVCLTGGGLANDIYAQVALRSERLTASRIHLWWNWDYYIATDNPDRNSLQALTRLAGVLALDPAKIHPIPSLSAATDPEVGAVAYAHELLESPAIDICLLELGSHGQIAGVFPQHLNCLTSDPVIGITDAIAAYPELITLTPSGLNACHEIWVMASGDDVASHLKQIFSQDPEQPGSHLTQSESLLWLADSAATSQLDFHHCSL